MGYVYILQSGDDNLFKIGRTEHDVESRIRQLSTGNPHPLTAFDVIETDYASKCESFLHNRLQAKRSRRSEAREFFELDPDELREAITLARAYVENDCPRHAEAERLSEAACEDRVVEPSQEALALYLRLLEVRADHDSLSHEKERLETDLKLLIGTASELSGLATWKAATQHRFDTESFERDEPDLYARYLHEIRSRRFVLL